MSSETSTETPPRSGGGTPVSNSELPNGHFVNGDMNTSSSSSSTPTSTPAPVAGAAGPPSSAPPNGGSGPEPYPPYGHPPVAQSPSQKPPPPGAPGYPPNRYSGPQGTPTLNSLLQGRHPRPQGPHAGPPQGYGPPGGYPTPHNQGGWDPNYAYRHPGPPGAPRPPYGPPGGQHSPYGPPPQNYPYPQHTGYPPQQRYPPPPGPPQPPQQQQPQPQQSPQQQQQPPQQQPQQQPQPQQSQPQYSTPPNSTPTTTNSAQTVTTSSTSTLPSVSTSDCPPPHPGSHEGRPSTTWTPPVQKPDGQQAQQDPTSSNTPPNAPPTVPSVKPSDEASNDVNDPQRTTPGVRPTPSPTGSSSSRSMSPAVATGGQQQMPPRPPSSTNPQEQQSKMASAAPPPSQAPPPQGPQGPPGGHPGGYPPQQGPPMGPPPHMMYNNKGGPPGPPGPGQHPYYGGPPAGQPPPGGHYGMRMGGPGGYGPPNSNSYGGYGRQNNIPSGYPGQQQQGPYGGNWGGGPPPPGGQPPAGMGPPVSKGQRPPGHYPPPRPPHPSQQHQMMKGGYPPNSYNGPPNYNGPPAPGMQPPPPSTNASTPGYPPGHPGHPGPTGHPGHPPGPPGSYPNSGPPPGPHGYPPISSANSMPPAAASTQSGATPTTTTSAPPTSTASAASTPTASAPGPGPDGFDESSQQSTLSQSSDRSDGRQTPKTQTPQQQQGGHPQHPPQFPHMGNFGQHGPPGSPHSSAPSPGGSMGSSGAGPDGGYPRDGMASPSWQRPPASPVSTPQTSSRSSDSLVRLYEMDDHPDRRVFLEKLLGFMEEKGTPITQCPTISKNPLDLFRLYLYTKERGGYLECTKQKTWKDIAAQLGIGASSSGAYTLKKHYGKNLLPFECYYDRGGIDPGPILAQVEAQTKKKAKAPSQPPPAPSPGSQDSRDSYSNSNSGMSSSEHYGGSYPPPGAPGGYNSYPGGPPPPGAGGPGGPPPPTSAADGRPPSHPGTHNIQQQAIKEPIQLGNPFDDVSGSPYAQGMPPGAAGPPGYPPNSNYGGYPPPPHSRPDSYPPGAYPPGHPSSYPPPQRMGWPPHQQPPGYGPPPANGGPPPTTGAPPGPPGSYTQNYYGPPRPGYTPPASSATGPPTTVTASGGPPGGPPNHSPYGPQPPYQDQYQPKPGGGPPGAAPTGPPGPPTSSAGSPGPPSSAGGPPPSSDGPQAPPPGASGASPTAGPPPGAKVAPPPHGMMGNRPPGPPQPPGMMGSRPPGPPQQTSVASTNFSNHSAPYKQASRPVILDSNVSPRPFSSTHSYGANSSLSTSSSGPPPPSQQGYPVKSMGPQHPRPPGGAPMSYPGQRPPMYPGQGPAGNWQNRFPGPNSGYPGGPSGDPRSMGPQSFGGPPGAPGPGGPGGPRMPPGAPGGPPPQWGSGGASDRSSYPSGPYGQPSWMRPGMRPPFARPGGPDSPGGVMRPSGPMARPGFPRGSLRNDLQYPPGSVEATLPLMMKRRKYTKVEVQPCDGWRLVMALRSGLLMESTWALDTLNILLFDDYAVSFFGLGNMPGLLEALLEHWRASLIAMFGISEDLEATTEKMAEKRTRKRSHVLASAKSKKWFEESRNDLALHLESSRMLDQADEMGDSIDEALGRVTNLNPKDKVTVLTTKESYTKRPRFAEEDIEMVDKDDTLFVHGDGKGWDTEGALMAQGSTHWDNGGGNSSDHIVTHFGADLDLVPFVRLLKDLRPKLKQEQDRIADEKGANNNSNATDVKILSKNYKNNNNKQQVASSDNKELPKVNGEIKVEEIETASKDTTTKKQQSDNNNSSESKGGDQPDDADQNHPAEDIIEKIARLTGITFRDPDVIRQRWKEEALEDENYVRDEPSLHLVTEANDSLGKRAATVSNILRNLSFVPGNEYELSRSAPFLAICGRLLLLNHWHPPRNAKKKNYDRGEEEETIESCTSLTGDDEWWWEYLHIIRENVMVALSNISGSLELKDFNEDISRPIFNGLLEWAVSTSAYAQDPFPNVGPNSPISPQGLAIETLCKLCLHETNVDLMLTTPPYRRIEKLTLMLAKKLNRYENQVLREFSINLLYYLSAADSGVARTIATSDLTIGLLLGFIEQAEQNAMVIAQKHGVNALRDNPDSMGTSLDMMRRAASTLSNISRHPDNIALFMRHEQRLLDMVMSQILDQGVASILSHVLYNIGLYSNKRLALALQQKKSEAAAVAAAAAAGNSSSTTSTSATSSTSTTTTASATTPSISTTS